jgi:hypothetical protein
LLPLAFPLSLRLPLLALATPFGLVLAALAAGFLAPRLAGLTPLRLAATVADHLLPPRLAGSFAALSAPGAFLRTLHASLRALGAPSFEAAALPHRRPLDAWRLHASPAAFHSRLPAILHHWPLPPATAFLRDGRGSRADRDDRRQG